MRWIKIDTSVNGFFSREVCPDDAEYLNSHVDTFKCMWHEQTQYYWIRLVVSLREYMQSHVFTSGFWESLAMPPHIVEAEMDNTYLAICNTFALEGYGMAKDLLFSVMFVMANQDLFPLIGSRPISNDPFYNNVTRDHFRTVFGAPKSISKAKLFQVFLTIQLFSRFAAAVVNILRSWIRTPDCTLLSFYERYTKEPYWCRPSDWCPHNYFFNVLDSRCVTWDCPELEELQEIADKAPDKDSGFQGISWLVKRHSEEEAEPFLDESFSYDDEYDDIDDDNVDYSVIGGDDAGGDGDHLVKGSNKSRAPLRISEYDGLFMGIADLLSSESLWDDHDEDKCMQCFKDLLGAKVARAACNIENFVSPLVTVTKEDRAFWSLKKVKLVLKLAEEKFERMVREKGLKLGEFQDVPPRFGKKKKKSKKRQNSSANCTNSKESVPQMNGHAGMGSTTALERTPEEVIAAAVEKLKLTGKVGSAATNGVAGSGKATKKDAATTRSVSNLLPKVGIKCCAKCGKSEGCKLKKCGLCVKEGCSPVYYCSRECQTQDWETTHQFKHMDNV